MKQIILCSLVFFSLSLSAQKITPSVISNAGAVMVGSNVTLEWTLGEVITERKTSQNLIVTQGFHQGNLGGPSATNNFSFQGVLVYPNPASDLLTIENKLNLKLQMRMIQLNGEQIASQMINGSSENLNISNYPVGTYILILSNENSQQSFTIEKINN